MQNPDYSKYSLDELKDALSHVDKNTYPERVKIILNELEKRNKNLNESRIITEIDSQEKVEKKKTYFEKFKLGDIPSCEKAIFHAYIASLILTIYYFVMTALAFFEIKFILNENFSGAQIFTVIVLSILTYNIYRKSKIAPWILLGYIMLNLGYIWYNNENATIGVLDYLLIYFLYKGGLASYKYHKLVPVVEAPGKQNGKVCPQCNELNHNANVRCGCGYEF